MSVTIVPKAIGAEAPDEGPVQAMLAQMLMLKQAHFGENVLLSPSDRMEANRIIGLPLAEQLTIFNEWAMNLAREARSGAQEEIAKSTRGQVELTNKLAASDEETVRLRALTKVDVLLPEALNKKTTLEELKVRIKTINGGREKERREDELEEMSVLFIDIDYFSEVNNTLGHVIGDEALKEFFTLVRSGFRDDDLIGRFGGEEFVVIMEGASAEDAAKKAESLRAKIESELKKMILKHCPDKVEKVEALAGTASVGIVSYGVDSKEQLTMEEVLERSDQAMYHAKNTGRNKVVVYEPKIIETEDREMAAKEEKPIES